MKEHFRRPPSQNQTRLIKSTVPVCLYRVSSFCSICLCCSACIACVCVCSSNLGKYHDYSPSLWALPLWKSLPGTARAFETTRWAPPCSVFVWADGGKKEGFLSTKTFLFPESLTCAWIFLSFTTSLHWSRGIIDYIPEWRQRVLLVLFVPYVCCSMRGYFNLKVFSIVSIQSNMMNLFDKVGLHDFCDQVCVTLGSYVTNKETTRGLTFTQIDTFIFVCNLLNYSLKLKRKIGAHTQTYCTSSTM